MRAHEPSGHQPPQTATATSRWPKSGVAIPMTGMKIAAATALSALIAIALIPVLLAGGDTPALACGVAAGPVEPILATIRTLESSGNYQAKSAGSSASGAYQFLDTTWNGYGGYTHAAAAPPTIQDAKATEHVTGILNQHNNDITTVPVIWYIGYLPAADSPAWDTVPMPGAGNVLTPRQYQQRWMTLYQQQTAAPTPSTSIAATIPSDKPTATTTMSSGSCIGGSVTPIDGDWSLPGPIALIEQNPNALNNPHAEYPAWDWMIPVGTPIYAVRSGTVTTVRTWAHNWWDQGCGTLGGGDCTTCGIGVTITDPTGVRWTYCHGSQLTTHAGATITAGQQILSSGNTGRSSGPHLHIEIRTPDGQPHCPQPLITNLYKRQRGIDPATLPTSGCNF
jgi:murein DD-endopeptidase MepM/ murein hydrolase activator NlpD